MVTAARAPMASVATDLSHGGRWTSLRLASREWLWCRDVPERAVVRAGEGFVDAGGLEECVPTVRGVPDHGAAWSRAWFRMDGWDVVDCDEFILRRRIDTARDEVVATYELSASPGYRFVWAAHALLDLSAGSRVVLPHGSPVRLYPEAARFIGTEWPKGQPHIAGLWPDPYGIALDELGPNDGTAIGASVLDRNSVDVIDGPHRLTLTVIVDDGTPTSIALWRNLGGYPPTNPYRSVGVEPMLGSVFDLADAGPGDAATVPASGFLRWQLHIRAERVDA
jgi:hypothetical protein